MYDLNAHVWWAQGEKKIKRKEGGSLFLLKSWCEKWSQVFYWTTYPLLSHYDFRMKRDPPPYLKIIKLNT